MFLDYLGEKFATMSACFCVWASMIRAAISDQYTDPWILEDMILRAPCGSHKLHAMYSWNLYTAAYLRAGMLLPSQELNLAEINHDLLAQAFPWKLHAFNRLQSTKIITAYRDFF